MARRDSARRARKVTKVATFIGARQSGVPRNMLARDRSYISNRLKERRKFFRPRQSNRRNPTLQGRSGSSAHEFELRKIDVRSADNLGMQRLGREFFPRGRNVMRYITILAALSIGSIQPAVAACADFSGATVLTSDGKYIGRVSSRYDSDSIFNPYGQYGSKFSTDSIWNPYGQNGSAYATTSAQNPYTTTPPAMYRDRKLIGYLSANKYLSGAVNPMRLGVACFGYEPQ